MPNLALLPAASLIAAAVSAGVLWLLVWPWRTRPAWRQTAGLVVGIGTGFYAGCGVLWQWPRWPLLEDRDRFLAVLFPLALVAELTAAGLRLRWQAWLLRICLAGVVAPILLHNTTYLADLSGPGSAEWSRGEALLILTGLAISLAGVWVLLARLDARAPNRTGPLVVGLTCLAAALTVMMSGYYRGGLLGLPLGGAILGAALAACFHRDRPARTPDDAALGIGLVGLFAILLSGRFFGALPTSLALCLWFGSLLAWTTELPGVRKLRPALRTTLGVALVVIVLALVVARARINFIKAWNAKVETSSQTSPRRSLIVGALPM